MHLATVSLVVVVSIGTLDMATDGVQMYLLEDRISFISFCEKYWSQYLSAEHHWDLL